MRVGEDVRVEAPPQSIFVPALRATTVGILIVITLIAFEAMAVSAALPTAARAVHGLGAFGWAYTGFLIANVVGMVAAGQLSDGSGPRLPLVAGLSCFMAGLVISGTATTMAQLVAGRVVQGLGSGLLITAIYVVIGQAYPEGLRPRLFAATSSAWVLPSLVGPVVSGALAQHASWRWVFLGLLPFALVGAALLVPVLRTLHPNAAGRTFTAPARLVRALGVAGGIAALEEAGQHPSARAIVLLAAGLAALAWGIRPLLPSGTLTVRPGVSAPIAMRGLLAGAFFGIESTVPLSLTLQHGYGATVAGLPLTGSALTWALGSWWQGRVDDDRHPRQRIGLIRAGFGFVAAGGGLMALAVLPNLPGWLAYVAWIVAGLGAGLTMSSVSVLMLKFTTDADRGTDSAALQLSDATAGALTTGLAGVLVAAAARGAISSTAGFVMLDLAMCAVAVAGAAVAGRARPAVRP
ncbi:MAG TPA: MFS transporter [Jatrophihabitans sp.]|nr:MFS transporter [Jatrophihabitans sp.]